MLLSTELDMEGTIAPDNDPPQEMGDSSIEVRTVTYLEQILLSLLSLPGNALSRSLRR